MIDIADAQVVWAPQPGSAVSFMSCPYYEVLYEGTRGVGKTDALIMDFGQHVGQGFGESWRGILFRQTFPQLEDVISKTKKWFPKIWPEARYNEAKSFWQWPTGERLMLRQFDKPDDYWKYHGHEYAWIAWEELCNWVTDEGYKRMMSTSRSTMKGMPRKVRATTNPYGPGHNWVKRRFRLPGSQFIPITDSVDEMGNVEPTRVAIHGTVYENKLLMEADPGYIQRISAAARNQAERRAWLNGDWDIVAGGMFDDIWDKRVHVLPNLLPYLPKGMRIIRSFDWGSSHPFSVGWHLLADGSDIVTPDRTIYTVPGDMIRIAEWYGCEPGKTNVGMRLLATQVSSGIVRREYEMGIHGRVKPGPADSQIYAEENGESIGVQMARPVRIDGKKFPGVRFTRADKRPGSRKTGWELMRTRLANAKIDEETGVRENAGYFICENCISFQETVPVLPRSDIDPDDVNTDAEDHIADEVRYAIRGSGKRKKPIKTAGVY